MSQMLYTKYRPKTLKEVINQDDTVKTLEKSIQNSNPASAYIFTGGRGTGKTSIARAFAKELSIHESDIIEMDAASNSKIEDIRELSQNMYSLPFYSKYKMYILDEVHMLSKNAANAFLKILEEPPSHVIFVLATTDPQKLPDTILSRCLQFTLKKPTLTQIEDYLKSICEKERVNIENGGIRSIAVLGDGSYRDSISHLQKVISNIDKKEKVSEEQVTEEQVSEILNIPTVRVSINYIQAVDSRSEIDIKLAIDELKLLSKNNSNVSFFSKSVLSLSRLIMLSRLNFLDIKEIEKSEGVFISGFISSIKQNKNTKLRSQELAQMLQIDSMHNQSSKIMSFELLLLNQMDK
jgi:DNA polymerase III subunit gamma/tau